VGEPGWHWPGVKVALRRFATLTPSAWVATGPSGHAVPCLRTRVNLIIVPVHDLRHSLQGLRPPAPTHQARR
jgi:hypothetical protein